MLSLAQAHSLLSDDSWKGADLGELVRDQLRLGSLDETRVVAAGPEVRLPTQIALHVALVLHELGTNARKYGALSAAHGHVELRWAVSAEALLLRWVERGGPAVSLPKKAGFGTTLIEQSVKPEGGVAHVSYAPEGLNGIFLSPSRNWRSLSMGNRATSSKRRGHSARNRPAMNSRDCQERVS
ncbi:MAG: sensor histidine kinase [Alphaproteobacteria bacterium]|nr:sensor histidine kinase [Alphaproteobacteria bacterium]